MNYIPYTPKADNAERIKKKLNGKGELLGFYKDERGYRYSLIKFCDCGHECYIGSGGNLECNNKKCLYEKMSRIRKVSHNRPEVKAKMRKINSENNAKPEVKAKHKKFFLEYWGKEENKNKQSRRKTQFYNTDQNRRSHSEILKAYYAEHEDYKKEITERLTNWRKSASDDELEEVNIKRIKTMNMPEHREKASAAFKEYYSNAENKKKYLERVARQQRNKKNKFEMIFIKILEDHNIDYVWQYPILTEDGKGFVIDFYLPEYEFFVNIDGSIHGFNGEIHNFVVDRRLYSDYMLDEYCKSHNLNICHIDTRDLKGFNFNIEEVINL